MKKYIVSLVICVAFLFGAWCEMALGQVQTTKTAPSKSVYDQQSAALKTYQPSNYPSGSSGIPSVLESSAFDCRAGELYLVGMNRGNDDQQAFPSLFGSTLANTSSSNYDGTLITATFVVYKCTGSITLAIQPIISPAVLATQSAAQSTSPASAAAGRNAPLPTASAATTKGLPSVAGLALDDKEMVITHPGTYQITAPAFTLQSNFQVTGRAFVFGSAAPNEPFSCYARVTSIQIKFQ